MNTIQELIQKLCPNVDEYEELQDVINLKMGNSPTGNTFLPIPEDEGLENAPQCLLVNTFNYNQ